jgi:hypothetical protein
MGPANVLSNKDANNSLKNLTGTGDSKADVKSMEYHRQVLKSKMEEEEYGNTTITLTNSVGVSSGLNRGTAINTAAAISAPVPSSQTKKMINKTLARPVANPVASGTCSSNNQYISPSDTIMSPCTAKLTALKGRQAGK